MTRALALALAAALVAVPAMAQSPKPKPFHPTGDLVNDVKTQLGGQPQGSNEGGGISSNNSGAQALLAKPFQDLANFIGDDAASAISLSTQIPTLQDGHGQQCWIALRDFTAVIKAHPIPISFHAMTDLEGLRLLQISANNLCSNVHCTQVFADLASSIQTAAPVNFSVPIPSLHDICSKIPQIPVVAPLLPVPADPSVPVAPASTTPAKPTGQ